MSASFFFPRQAAAALALALCSSLAAADTTVAVSIDTSSFGTDGWLDFTYAGASNGTALPSTVTLANFAGFDSAAEVFTDGQVSGSLGAGYVIGNGGGYNDLFHAVNYGGVLSFTVTFSGDADPAAIVAGSTFAVTAYDADQQTQLGSSSDELNGSLLTIDWTPAAVAGGQGSIATAVYSDFASVSAVPEPSSWLMLGIGAMLVAGVARRKAAAFTA
ncbi:putative secreted protein with PEP-CTERM sorting signal [Pseudoduganella lurida]|uniref:Putative secreted protein with PEP-CTERM sorting signal n=1 Tax=Pseudoduganella lurida TaxID=1036180 RepID=A0A562R7T8_9BURK|nr:NF038129 family PEP-CTERM protein [Pseudoduganella lurida]TWI65127.1 putative secreted protein with PEP-CTERM sorting signal [Pseudoduganella lurida]